MQSSLLFWADLTVFNQAIELHYHLVKLILSYPCFPAKTLVAINGDRNFNLKVTPPPPPLQAMF